MLTAMPIPVKVKLLRDGAKLPASKTDLAAGADLSAVLREDQGDLRNLEDGRTERVLTLYPMGRTAIGVGFAMEIPPGYEAQIRARSSLGAKGIIIPNAPATIGGDSRGEPLVLLMHLEDQPLEIRTRDRIARMVIAAVPPVAFVAATELSDTARGAGGFGSTGR